MSSIEFAIRELRTELSEKVDVFGSRLDVLVGPGVTTMPLLSSLIPVKDYCGWVTLGEQITTLAPLDDEFNRHFDNMLVHNDPKCASHILDKFINRKFAMQLSMDGKTKMPFKKTRLALMIISKLEPYYQTGVADKSAKNAVGVWLRQSENTMRKK